MVIRKNKFFRNTIKVFSVIVFSSLLLVENTCAGTETFSNVNDPVKPKLSGKALFTLKKGRNITKFKPFELIIDHNKIESLSDKRGWNISPNKFIWSPSRKDPILHIPLKFKNFNERDNLFTSNFIHIDYEELNPENPSKLMYSIILGTEKYDEVTLVKGGNKTFHCLDIPINKNQDPDIPINKNQDPDIPINKNQDPDILDVASSNLIEKDYLYLAKRKLRLPYNENWVHILDPNTGTNVFQRQFDRDLVFAGPVDLYFSKFSDLNNIHINIRISIEDGILPVYKQVVWEAELLPTQVIKEGSDKFLRVHVGEYIRRLYPDKKKIQLRELIIITPNDKFSSSWNPLQKIIFNKSEFPSYYLCKKHRDSESFYEKKEDFRIQVSTQPLNKGGNWKRLVINMFGMANQKKKEYFLKNMFLSISPSNSTRGKSGIRVSKASLLPVAVSYQNTYIYKGEHLIQKWGGPYLTSFHSEFNRVEWPKITGYLPLYANNSKTEHYQADLVTENGIKIISANGALVRLNKDSKDLEVDVLLDSADPTINLSFPAIDTSLNEQLISLRWHVEGMFQFQPFIKEKNKLSPYDPLRTTGNPDEFKLFKGEQLILKLTNIDQKVFEQNGRMHGKLIFDKFEKNKPIPTKKALKFLHEEIQKKYLDQIIATIVGKDYETGSTSKGGIQIHAENGAFYSLDMESDKFKSNVLIESLDSSFSISFPSIGRASVNRIIELEWIKNGPFFFQLFVDSDGTLSPVELESTKIPLKKGQALILKLTGFDDSVFKKTGELKGLITILKAQVISVEKEMIGETKKDVKLTTFNTMGASFTTQESLEINELSTDGLLLTGTGKWLNIDWNLKTSISKKSRFFLSIPKGFESIVSMEIMPMSHGQVLSSIFATPNDSFEFDQELSEVDNLRIRLIFSEGPVNFTIAEIAIFEPQLLAPEEAFISPILFSQFTLLVPKNLTIGSNNKVTSRPGVINAVIYPENKSPTLFSWRTKIGSNTNWIRGLKIKHKVPQVLSNNNPCWLKLTFVSTKYSFNKVVCPNQSDGEIFLPAPFYSDNEANKAKFGLSYELDSITWSILSSQKLDVKTPIPLNFEFKLDQITYQSAERLLNSQVTNGWKDKHSSIEWPKKVTYTGLFNKEIWADFKILGFSKESIASLNRSLGENLQVEKIKFSNPDLKITPFKTKKVLKEKDNSNRNQIFFSVFTVLAFLISKKFRRKHTKLSNNKLLAGSTALYIAGFLWVEILMIWGILGFVFFFNRVVLRNRNKLESRWPVLSKHIYESPRGKYVFGFILTTGITILFLLIGLKFISEQTMNIAFFMYLFALFFLALENYQNRGELVSDSVK
jgi:hypothetical protein